MDINLGLRLVITLPTLLFLVGFSLKCMIERFNLEKLMCTRDGRGLPTLRLSFLFVFGIETIILSLANGLIISFEIGAVELGILAMISGIIISMIILTGIYTTNIISIFGYLAAFGLLTGEFGYFMTAGTKAMIGFIQISDQISFSIGLVLGILMGGMFIYLAFPSEDDKKNLKTT